MPALRTIRHSDTSYRACTVLGETVGFIHVWHETSAVNKTGVKRFRAKPLGLYGSHDAETLSAALAYLLPFAPDY